MLMNNSKHLDTLRRQKRLFNLRFVSTSTHKILNDARLGVYVKRRTPTPSQLRHAMQRVTKAATLSTNTPKRKLSLHNESSRLDLFQPSLHLHLLAPQALYKLRLLRTRNHNHSQSQPHHHPNHPHSPRLPQQQAPAATLAPREEADSRPSRVLA
jgi:hypothetical protein